MKKTAILLTLLMVAGIAIAEEAAPPRPKMTASRHTILPFIGYQILDGGATGYDFTIAVKNQIYLSDTTVNVHSDRALDTQAPTVGLAYRYTPMNWLYGELSLGAMLDKRNTTYPLAAKLSGFTRRTQLQVSVSHTYFAGADLSGFYKLPYNLRIGLKGGAGYVWRSITDQTESPGGGITESVVVLDPDRMVSVRGGAELQFYRDDALMIAGTLLYTHFVPLKSGQKAFGGIGWQFSMFPMWLN